MSTLLTIVGVARARRGPGSRKHTHSDSSGSSDVGCCDAGSAAETPAAPVHSSKKARKRAPAENLDGLVDQLLELFEGDEADVDEVKAAMAAYTPDREDWCKYEHWDNHKYTRNLVHKGNGKFNLIMLCWNTGQARCVRACFAAAAARPCFCAPSGAAAP